MGMKTRTSGEVELTQDPDTFPNTGLSLAVRWLADRVNWIAVVDGLLPWDAQRAKIAPSTVLLTLVMNVLTQRNPLYRVEDWVATLPLPMLWGDAIQASQFNDDALGRVLEDLADHGQALLATLGTRMQAVEQVGPRFLHADTSAFALFGDYPDTPGPTAPVRITYGHSKDHRPDLRQIMTGLTVDDHGQVVAGTMLSGNTSDRQWHPDWLEQLAGDVPEDFWRGSCYISDAAVVTQVALTRVASLGMDWLGRLPASYRLAKSLKERAWADGGNWVDVGVLSPKRGATRYRSQTFDVVLYDQPTRAFVYHSDALDKKKEHTLQREIRQESDALAAELKGLERITFDCEADARAAVDAAIRRIKPRWFRVDPVMTQTCVPIRRRGRPKKDAVPETRAGYRAGWQSAPPSAERIQHERERRSTFVLVSSRQNFSAMTALQAYKRQDQDEHGFRWMKEPLHLGAFFLEKPARVAGLGFLLLLALQFSRFMRAMVRHALADQPALEIPHRKVQQPSDAVILDALRALWVLRKEDGTDTWFQWGHVPAYTRRILDALQIPVNRRFVWDPSE